MTPQSDLEESLGLTKTEKGLGLVDDKVPNGLLQKVGNLVRELLKDVGVTALLNILDKTLGGTLYGVLDAIGLTYLEKNLGLEK